MKLVSRGFAVIIAAILLSACVLRPAIRLVGYESGFDEEGDSVLLITISANSSLDVLAEQTSINLIGSMHICGNESRYRSVQYLRDTDRIEGTDWTYRFEFPSSIDKQTASQPSGEIAVGWPSDLVMKMGVCFQVSGGVTGRYVRSETIELEGLEKKLIEDVGRIR
jgi:hypothetical protein